MLLQFTTARLITNYDNVLLQFTIAWLLQFSTTVITIYDRYYNSRHNTCASSFSSGPLFQWAWLVLRTFARFQPRPRQNPADEVVLIRHLHISHTTGEKNPKGNMYGIWSIHCSWRCNCRTYFCYLPFVLSFPNHPQYISGLSRALFSTTFLDYLSRNSYIHFVSLLPKLKNRLCKKLGSKRRVLWEMCKWRISYF